MLIYRVEHERNGLGPYQNVACGDRHYCNDECCPAPDADGIEKYRFTQTYYGCKSTKDLVHWFGKDYIRQFSYLGLHVYSYRVPDNWVSMGKKHLGFSRTKAYRVRRINLCDL